MYKVFYNNRVVYLREQDPKLASLPGRLVERYEDRAKLKLLLDDFSENKQVSELYIYHPDLDELGKAFTSNFKSVKAGGGLVFNGEGEFFVMMRNGMWDLPKGKMEKGEDFETTALREVEEETGLTGLEPLGLLLSTFHTYPHNRRMVLKETRWFEMQWKGKGEPKLQSREGITDYRWVKPGETDFIRENTYASILDVLRVRKQL
jgi:8-oxo-dGTP pyrophosphatase MutT (NUDIX family)